MLVAPLPLPESGHQKAPLPSGGAFAFLGAGFQQYVLDSKSTAQDPEILEGRKLEIIGRIDCDLPRSVGERLESGTFPTEFGGVKQPRNLGNTHMAKPLRSLE